MFLSIIIPVYNVEPYIERCLQSVSQIDMNGNDFEVIIVNDGTKDNSMAIVDDYTRKYSNFKSVNQKNKGLSGARNTGFKLSKGDYVWFVDSDDSVNPDVSLALERCKKSCPDVVMFDVRYIMKDGLSSISKRGIDDRNQVYGGLEMLKKYGTSGVWSYFYRSTFLRENNIFFIEGRLHEDDAYNIMVLSLAKQAIYINSCLYNYDRSREGSITNTFSIKRITSYLENIDLYLDIADQSHFSVCDKAIICGRASALFNELLTISFSEDKERNKELITMICAHKKNIMRVLLTSGVKTYKLESIALGISVRAAVGLYVGLRKRK